MSGHEGRLSAVPVTDVPDDAGAIETTALTKRYRRATALSDCSVTVPQGRISALVGPNGAGKSTLLRLLTGLARPSGGSALVLGTTPRQDPAFLADIGYLAQDVPLYRRLSAEDHIRACAALNKRWDAATARTRLRELRVPLDRAVGTLSGGSAPRSGCHSRSPSNPGCCCLTSPSPPSIPSPGGTSSRPSPPPWRRPRAASPSCCPRT